MTGRQKKKITVILRKVFVFLKINTCVLKQLKKINEK